MSWRLGRAPRSFSLLRGRRRLTREDRMIVLDSQAPQHSPLFGREICTGMDRAAVIPNDQIARPPDMFINKF